MKEQKTCPHCGRPLMPGDTECGYCGAKLGGGSGKKLLVLALVLVLVAGLGLGGWWLYQNDPISVLISPNHSRNSDGTDLLDQAVAYAQESLEIFPYSEADLADFLEIMDYPRGIAQQAAAQCGADWNANALKRALMCLEDEYIGYTRESLVEALEWDNFTPDQIQYAMDNLPEVDWQEQANRCAASYLQSVTISRTGLLEQLEYEGFAPELAQNAVDSCGADWAELALAAAKEESTFKSDEDLRLILDFYGFTEEEIQYAIDNR